MQAALNILREQRRAVLDVHRQILNDDALKVEDAAHWRQLAGQASAEAGELMAAITLLEKVMDGRLIEEPGAMLPARIGGWEERAPGRLVATEVRS
ncbi:MAG: hypothetical protein ACREEY_15515 [Brevundimonas sp.]